MICKEILLIKTQLMKSNKPYKKLLAFINFKHVGEFDS